MTQPVTAVLFGAVLRGADAYGPYALEHPDELKFVAVAESERGQTEAMTSARASLESHLLAFAAEESHHRKVVIDMQQFRKKK